jgi:IS30 family transposase
VGVQVVRTSRLVLLAKMDDATAVSALIGFTAKLNSIAAPLRQSLTYDQGKEMARHAEITVRTGVKVYCCDRHSPWQRGICDKLLYYCANTSPRARTCPHIARRISMPPPIA